MPEWRTQALSLPALNILSQSSFPEVSAGSDSRTHGGPHGSLPPRVYPRLISLLTQRCVEDSRALHLVAIQPLASAGLLRPRADVRVGELLLFILSF